MEKCHVDGCGKDADLEVILYDFYMHGDVFFGQDFTSPYICMEHAMGNESKAQGERRPRGTVHYPYTNRGVAQWFTIYRPIESWRKNR